MQIAAKKGDGWLGAAWSKYEQGLAPVQMNPEYPHFILFPLPCLLSTDTRILHGCSLSANKMQSLTRGGQSEASVVRTDQSEASIAGGKLLIK